MDPLAVVDTWSAANAAAGVVRNGEIVASHGDVEHRFALASVTKLLVAYATLIGVEEGTVDLDEPAGPPGSTVRHLVSHTSGLGFEGTEPPSRPGTRRVYSNAGIEALARHLEHTWRMSMVDYLRDAVLAPLGMDATSLDGSPAHGAHSTVADLARFAAELQAPRLLAAETLAMATHVQFPGLAGVLPGFGRQDPCDWGLGFELRDGKRPHWTGARNSEATFGHFGGRGTFLWVDPSAGLACVVLTDRDFAPWATTAWPELSDAVLGRFA